MRKTVYAVDDEFKSLIPPLQAEERLRLVQSLLDEGCRDALIVWKEQKILVDGHNRYEICREHGIPYKVTERTFTGRDHVKQWIITNQIARRNISKNWRDYLIGLEYRSLKQQGARTDLTSPQNGEKSKTTTAQKVAASHDVSKTTVERAAKFSTAVDQVAEKYGNEYRYKLLDKDIVLPQKDLDKFLKLSNAYQRAALELLDSGKAKSLEAAYHLHQKRINQRQQGTGGDEFDEEEGPPATFCQEGDLWKLGIHYLGCFDATLERSYDLLMGGNRASIVFTDPPYNANYIHKGEKILNDSLTPEQFRHLLDTSLTHMLKHCDGAAYICMGATEIDVLKQSFKQSGGHFGDLLIWVKNTTTMGWSDFQRQYELILYGWREGGTHYFAPSRSESNVWAVDSNTTNEWHIAQKPIALIERAIRLSTRKRGEIVLDPFAGSGSTLIACHRKVRRAYLMELDPKRCDKLVERFVRETQFELMPMLARRNGEEVLRSLRQVCESDEKLSDWFTKERKKFGHAN